MSNSPTGRSAELFPKLEKPNLGVFVPGTGIPLFGGFAARAIPRSASMDRLPGESYFTLADRFIAPFVQISLRALDRIIPALDRRLNARQRRRIRRQMRREMEKAVSHALMYGRP